MDNSCDGKLRTERDRGDPALDCLLQVQKGIMDSIVNLNLHKVIKLMISKLGYEVKWHKHLMVTSRGGVIHFYEIREHLRKGWSVEHASLAHEDGGWLLERNYL